MKRIFFILLFLILSVLPASSATVFSTGQPVPPPFTAEKNVRYSHEFSSFTAAVSSIGTTTTTLIVDTVSALTATTTVPSTLSVRVDSPGKITKTLGVLVINGPFSAVLSRVFSGFSAGDVTFGAGSVKEVYPEWWGITGTADETAINAALIATAGSNVPVQLLARDYTLSTILKQPSNTTLIGSGYGTNIIIPNTFTWDGAQGAIYNTNRLAGDSNIYLGNLRLTATDTTHVGYMIARYRLVTGLTIKNIYTASTYSSWLTPITIDGGVSKFFIKGCNITNGATNQGGAVWIFAGFSVDSTLDTHDGSITENILSSTKDEPLSIYAGDNSIYNVSITGNTLINRNNLSLAILSYNVGGQSGNVRNCEIAGNTMEGRINVIADVSNTIIVGNTIHYGFYNAPVSDYTGAVNIAHYGTAYPNKITVDSNSILTGTYGHLDAVYLEGDNCTIKNNSIYNSNTGATAVSILRDGNSIKNNRIESTANSMSVYDGVNGLTIDGNEFISGNHQVKFLGSASNIDIRNNKFKDPTAGYSNIIFTSATATANSLNVFNNTFNDGGTGANSALYITTGATVLNSSFEHNKIINATNIITASFAPYFFKMKNLYRSTVGGAYADWPITKGTTAQRPSSLLGAYDLPFIYLDTTLDADGLPIFWQGTKFIKSDGTDA